MSEQPAAPGRAGRLRAATQTLAGAAVLITVVTLLSRAVGFVRSLALLGAVGTDGLGAAYTAANTLPNVLFEVAAGGALAGSIVPLLAGPIARRAGVETSRIASAMLGWTLLVLVPLGVLLAALADPIAGALVSSGRSADLVPVVAAFLRVFAVQVPLYGIAVVLGGVLQAHRRFFWPAAAPLVSSLVVIAVFAGFGTLSGGADPSDPGAVPAAAFAWLAWGTTLGVAFLALPLVVPVRRTGVRLRPTLRFPGGEGRRAARLAFAGIAALVAQQASVLVVMRAAYHFGPESTYAVYFQAQQVYLLPYAVLAFPLATSSFPRLAEHVATARFDAFRGLLASTTRALLVVAGVGTAALVAASGPVEAVYGSFARGDVTGMGAAISGMAAGLLGYALVLHLSRALYTIDHQRAAVVATAAGWVVVAVAAFALPALTGAHDQEHVLVWLGLATTVGMSVAGAGLLLAVRRHAGPGALHGVPRTLLVLAAGVTAGSVAGAAVGRALLDGDDPLPVALGVGVLAALVAVVVVVGVSLVADRAALLGLVRRGRPAGGDGTGDDEGTSGGGAPGPTGRPEGPDEHPTVS